MEANFTMGGGGVEQINKITILPPPEKVGAGQNLPEKLSFGLIFLLQPLTQRPQYTDCKQTSLPEHQLHAQGAQVEG